MIKFKYTILSLCTLIPLGACSPEGGNDTPTPPTPSPSEKMGILISTTMDSRATDDAFEEGDNLGLFIVNHNADGSEMPLKANGNYIDNTLLTYRNSSWTSATSLYWKDESTPADFYVYYPYTTTISNVEAMPFQVKANQSNLSDYKTGDLLIGKTMDMKPTRNAVNINAKHMMSQMIITLRAGNGFTVSSLAAADVHVKINQLKTHATVHLSSGEVTATGDATDIIPLKEADKYKALIIPQAVADGNLITVHVDGRDFNLAKASNFQAFETGKRYNFTVTLNKTSNGVNIGITQWEEDEIDYGGTAE